ncbi:MAG: hypothetical protein ACK4K7_00275 [Allosphingosinicella sp.]|uniref:hypothetical protein n=1 Tax=Allosphingosinicella sp. TaxID=2823234 RepID=UPI0039549A3A
MPLPRPASPKALWTDLRSFFRQRSKHQLIAAFLALTMPLVIIFGFIRDAQTNIGPRPQVIYVESWPEDRTDEEIVAAQREHQAQREAAQAERQRQYKELQRRLGMQ